MKEGSNFDYIEIWGWNIIATGKMQVSKALKPIVAPGTIVNLVQVLNI